MYPSRVSSLSIPGERLPAVLLIPVTVPVSRRQIHPNIQQLLGRMSVQDGQSPGEGSQVYRFVEDLNSLGGRDRRRILLDAV